MWKLIKLMLGSPLRSLKFTYTFAAQVLLVCLKHALLPHLPKYQSFRTQIHRAYLSSSATLFFPLTHRLPVTGCPEERARRVGDGWTAYVIPGTSRLEGIAQDPRACAIVYSHGGGYARGEARMYLNYMERWIKEGRKLGLEFTFVSVEYRKVTC